MKLYQSIRETARFTGLSESFLRRGVKNGEIPHLMVGTKALINVQLLIEMYEKQCRQGLTC